MDFTYKFSTKPQDDRVFLRSAGRETGGLSGGLETDGPARRYLPRFMAAENAAGRELGSFEK